MVNIDIYRNAARKYLPNEIRFLIIAESPPWFRDPEKMAYFYFEKCPDNEMFFATLIKGILGTNYSKLETRKRKLLLELRDYGI